MRYVPTQDSFVVAEYEGECYLGNVIDVDEHDQDAHISFMEKSRGKCAVPTFKWPSPADKVWINFDKIFCTVEIIPQGKTKRLFKIKDEYLDKVKDFLQNKIN